MEQESKTKINTQTVTETLTETLNWLKKKDVKKGSYTDFLFEQISKAKKRLTDA